MKVFNDTYNLLVGAFVTFFSVVFGTFWYIFVAYMLLNIIDWLTGWYKSYKLHIESSKMGLQGIVKKLLYWVLVAVAFLVSDVFVKMGKDVLNLNLEFLLLVGWFTLACLMVNEVRSILENLVELGIQVPSLLTDGLAITEKLLKKQSDDNNKKGEEPLNDSTKKVGDNDEDV